MRPDRPRRRAARNASRSGAITTEPADVVRLIATTPEGLTAAEIADALAITLGASTTRVSRMKAAGQVRQVRSGGPPKYRLPAQLSADDLLAGERLWNIPMAE